MPDALDAHDTTHDDLRGGRAPWQITNRLTRHPLGADRRCGVLVVGAGITGALMAQHLSEQGHDVCVIDRERPGLGSTAASTAMLLWEIDKPLTTLTAIYGFEHAARVYRQSVAAVAGLKELVASHRIPCAFRPRSSLYLAAGEHGARTLLAEHELRQRAGLPGAFLDYRTLRGEYGFDREAALLSPGVADTDPLCLARGLMTAAIARGAAFFEADAVRYEDAGQTVAVTTGNGVVIEAEWVVLATGYAMPDFVQSPLHSISASWAIATPPQPEKNLWRDGVLIWEAATDYLYARTTADHRIIIGGEDDDEMSDPDERNAQTPKKTEALLAKLRALQPSANAVADKAWSGAFGQTCDGLPLIGAVPGRPRMLAAYGYGGNGITFSFLASRLIGATIGGQHKAEYDDYSLERPLPHLPD
jgi:glycine/D-amino acid oxidase-like deaminating enzyme